MTDERGVHEHVFDVWRAGYVAFCAICDLPQGGWHAAPVFPAPFPAASQADSERVIAEWLVERDKASHICGVIWPGGPNGEPLACAWPPNPSGEPMHEHSWSWVPTPSAPAASLPPETGLDVEPSGDLFPNGYGCSQCDGTGFMPQAEIDRLRALGYRVPWSDYPPDMPHLDPESELGKAITADRARLSRATMEREPELDVAEANRRTRWAELHHASRATTDAPSEGES